MLDLIFKTKKKRRSKVTIFFLTIDLLTWEFSFSARGIDVRFYYSESLPTKNYCQKLRNENIQVNKQ